MRLLRAWSVVGALLPSACAPDRPGAAIRPPAEAPAAEAPTTKPIVIGEAFTAGLSSYHRHFQGESHATLYHPAALQAFRTLFAPQLASRTISSSR